MASHPRLTRGLPFVPSMVVTGEPVDMPPGHSSREDLPRSSNCHRTWTKSSNATNGYRRACRPPGASTSWRRVVILLAADRLGYRPRGARPGCVRLRRLTMSLWTFRAGALYGITGVFIAELFEARGRCFGISFGYQMAGMVGGALTPTIATALLQWAGGASWPFATYLASEGYRMGVYDERPGGRCRRQRCSCRRGCAPSSGSKERRFAISEFVSC